jgi:uroporphyrinogen III methyltransferase/synthase
LFGRNIVVTRDERGNAEFAAKIIERGGNPVEFPTIRIEPLTNSSAFVQTLARLDEYHWVIFTSVNGVRVFLDALGNLSRDCRVLASAKIAAIGSKTAERLSQFGITADFVPNVFTGNELAKQLIAHTNVREKRVLLLRSDLASREILDLLQQANALVDDVAIYTAAEVRGDCEKLVGDLAADKIDWLTFASPSAVKSFFRQITPALLNSCNAKVASIGPVTSEQLRQLEVKVAVEAVEHTIDGLLTAIEEFSDKVQATK